MTTTADQVTPLVLAKQEEPPPRNSRAVLPLWRIQGRFTLATPLHIGNGQDEPIKAEASNTEDETSNFVAEIARDHTGKPYLPGSGIKGALRSLALRTDASPKILQRLFGSMDASDCTTPAQVEFCNAYMVEKVQGSGLPAFDVAKQRALLPHSVRNRDYGTVQDKLFFTEQVVPPGAQFAFECTAQNLSQEDIQTLLGILELAGQGDSSFQLGGRKTSNNGRVSWTACEVRRIEDFTALWKAVQTHSSTPVDLWACGVVQKRIPPKPLALRSDQLLVLNSLELKFHTPFLVYEKIDKEGKPDLKNGPDGKPRTNHAGRAALPASSLHGALRSQAERILRTLGEATPEGYKVPAVFGLDKDPKLNLAAVLFGAPGWRGVLQCSDFLAPANSPTIDHHMVAIDRLTGGGKDSAKFSIKALDCPTLSGSIRLDLGRLGKLALYNPAIEAQCLGLLAHVLRDLDEGDIALGYGAAKGYGRSHSTCISKLEATLAVSCLDAYLKAFADAMPETGAGDSVQNVPAHPQAALPTVNGKAGGFHNPYVFLPLPKLSSKDDRLPWAGYAGIPASHHSHAAYHANALHGRILCKLETQTPIFIGAGEVKNTQDPAQQKNFTMAKRQASSATVLRDQIALPATSLRGMLSSLHESISKSALRVMDDRSYSMRQSTGDDEINAFSSSAIGRIHVAEDGKVSVEPLTIPTLSANDRYRLPESFFACYPSMDEDGASRVFSKVLLEPQRMDVPQNCDYKVSKQQYFDDPNGRGYWYLPLEAISLGSNRSCQGYEHFREKNGYAIGQRPTPHTAYPRSQSEFSRMPEAEQRKHVRGFIRSMDFPGRQLPKATVRKYELFIPFPVELELHTLPCTDQCLERFKALAKERYDLQSKKLPADHRLRLPYSPVNQARSEKELTPQTGDLVFFKPSIDGKSIGEISYSSIWRARIEDEKGGYNTRRALGSLNHAPLQKDSKRNVLSPSEMLFGFVQDMGEEYKRKTAQEKAENPALAFASKVRFGFGLSVNPVKTEAEVTLKILASPKPPSPAMYFKPGAGPSRYISKAELAKNPSNYVLQGRKTYLHALRTPAAEVQHLDANGNPVAQGQGRLPWASANGQQDAKQKVGVKPIAKGETFYFEVDFMNLNQTELESLCATLVPHPNYQHKLGMGKPIGLGSVKIQPIGLYLVNRQTRYRQVSFGAAGAPIARYDSVWKSAQFPATLPHHLEREHKATATAGHMASPEQLAQQQMAALKAVELALYNAIVLSGNPDAVKLPVHYPQVGGQPIESKTYQWFVENDRAHAVRQHLAPFTETSNALPVLKRTP